ncbi:DUF1178 family protein [Roseateles violae]|uniref:DUF1178 family protein n=1 Tax=Roseateles violae TaxID=3058042 RepID=A0ABT8DTL8_9BURK|nr:DUF1178 family protein [Pelomonas sp. PFR6]MDN3921627.1 DUF1178 family protein [Pelomonas sp. PFR6]
MLVLNLACGLEHRFEGWFGSSDDFDAQLQRGLIACPVCGDAHIERRPNAPRLNVTSSSSTAAAPRGEAAEIAAGRAALQQQLQQMAQQVVRQLLADTEDVGSRFAEEARRIHYGEAEQRGIRGQASLEEAATLVEEGIAVLPLPHMAKETLQ